MPPQALGVSSRARQDPFVEPKFTMRARTTVPDRRCGQGAPTCRAAAEGASGSVRGELSLLFAASPAILFRREGAGTRRRDSMGDKSPKAKERDKKQKTSAKDQEKAQKAAATAAKAKK